MPKNMNNSVLAQMGEEEMRPDYTTGGYGPEIPPELLQHAMTIFAQEHGREAGTDSDMMEIQKIVDEEMGVSPKGAVDADTDPHDAMDFSDNEGPRANGTGVYEDEEDPDWSSADAYNNAGMPPHMKPRHAIPEGMGEDDMPYTNTVDYGSGVDPRLNPQSMGFEQSIMQPDVDLQQMQMPMDGANVGGPSLPGPLDALIAQMSGGGQPPMPAGPGQADPNMMEQLIQSLMGGGRR